MVAPGPDFNGKEDRARYLQGRVVEERDSANRYPFRVDWSPTGPPGKLHCYNSDCCSLVVVTCAEVCTPPPPERPTGSEGANVFLRMQCAPVAEPCRKYFLRVVSKRDILIAFLQFYLTAQWHSA